MRLRFPVLARAAFRHYVAIFSLLKDLYWSSSGREKTLNGSLFSRHTVLRYADPYTRGELPLLHPAHERVLCRHRPAQPERLAAFHKPLPHCRDRRGVGRHSPALDV